MLSITYHYFTHSGFFSRKGIGITHIYMNNTWQDSSQFSKAYNLLKCHGPFIRNVKDFQKRFVAINFENGGLGYQKRQYRQWCTQKRNDLLCGVVPDKHLSAAIQSVYFKVFTSVCRLNCFHSQIRADRGSTSKVASEFCLPLSSTFLLSSTLSTYFEQISIPFHWLHFRQALLIDHSLW